METNESLWSVFWAACKETPEGMFYPLKSFWLGIRQNPTLRVSADQHA